MKGVFSENSGFARALRNAVAAAGSWSALAHVPGGNAGYQSQEMAEYFKDRNVHFFEGKCALFYFLE